MFGLPSAPGHEDRPERWESNCDGPFIGEFWYESTGSQQYEQLPNTFEWWRCGPWEKRVMTPGLPNTAMVIPAYHHHAMTDEDFDRAIRNIIDSGLVPGSNFDTIRVAGYFLAGRYRTLESDYDTSHPPTHTALSILRAQLSWPQSGFQNSDTGVRPLRDANPAVYVTMHHHGTVPDDARLAKMSSQTRQY